MAALVLGDRLAPVAAIAEDLRATRLALVEAARDAIEAGADAGQVAELIMRTADTPLVVLIAPLPDLELDVERAAAVA